MSIAATQKLAEGSVYAGGLLAFLAQFQSEITLGVVISTGVVSIVCSIWGKINESTRNKILRENGTKEADVTKKNYKAIKKLNLSSVDLDQVKEALDID